MAAVLPCDSNIHLQIFLFVVVMIACTRAGDRCYCSCGEALYQLVVAGKSQRGIPLLCTSMPPWMGGYLVWVLEEILLSSVLGGALQQWFPGSVCGAGRGGL